MNSMYSPMSLPAITQTGVGKIHGFYEKLVLDALYVWYYKTLPDKPG